MSGLSSGLVPLGGSKSTSRALDPVGSGGDEDDFDDEFMKMLEAPSKGTREGGTRTRMDTALISWRNTNALLVYEL
jgi:hypothetical protein